MVALAPDLTEVVFALSAADRLVAVAEAADFPDEARRLPRVDPASLESILAHRPDLVLATTAGNDPRIIARLSGLGVRTCTVDPTSLGRVAEGFRLVAEVLGVPDRGKDVEESFARRVREARSRARSLVPRNGLYIVWWQPLMVAGPGTFHHDLLAAAGIANLAPAGAGRYPRVNPELLLDPRVELLVAPDEVETRIGFRSLAGKPVGRRLRSGNVPMLWVAADAASRPGPRLAEALEHLVEMRSAQESSPPRLPDPGSGFLHPPQRGTRRDSRG